MSLIAWDGKTIAADKGSWKSGIYWVSVTKLLHVDLCEIACKRFRLPVGSRIVWGICGNASEIPLVLEYMENGGDAPTMLEKEYSTGLILDKETGKIYGLTGLLTLEHYDNPKVLADGAGFEMALGCLYSGKSATETIEIVAKHTDRAAGGVDSYTLPDEVVANRDGHKIL